MTNNITLNFSSNTYNRNYKHKQTTVYGNLPVFSCPRKNIRFTSGSSISTVTTNGIKSVYNHKTSFFRNLPTIKFLCDYLKVYFPEGVHIANFASSEGEEIRSIAMILDNDRYKITGFDIIKKVINQAKKGLYCVPVQKQSSNSIKIDSPDFQLSMGELNNEKYKTALIKYVSKFNDFFDLVYHKPVTKKSLEYDHFKCYRAKDEKFQNKIMGFEVGDICNFDKKNLKELNTGIFIFKNAWYHLSLQDESMKNIEMVVQNIHDVLPKNGLLVCGSLFTDHFSTREIIERYLNDPRFIKKESTFVINNSKFHEILKNTGFKPVFYDTFDNNNPLKLPSVWKKV